MQISIERFTALVYQWVYERISKEELREKWEMDMLAPLRTSVNREPTQAELEMEFKGWESLIAAQGG